MKRRVFVSGLLAVIALTGQSQAQDLVANVVAQLRNQGFGSITQETTLLGRVRLYAVRKDGTREIIINPRTGEILRDLWLPISGDEVAVAELVDEGKVPESGDQGTSDDGEADGDDGGDDDDGDGDDDDGDGDDDDGDGDDGGDGDDDDGGDGDDDDSGDDDDA